VKWLRLLVAAIPLAGQSISVYSEFARINAAGEVAAPANPREILSPALVRNGFTSFQLVVQVKPGTPFWLYIGENPSDIAHLSLHREKGDHLEQVEIPHDGNSTEVLWMDVWIDRNAPVRRVKIEPQLKADRDWATPYPMEVRVVEATVPDGASAMKPLCGDGPPIKNDIANMRHRNAQQDAALAARVIKEDLAARCVTIPANDPEAYLRIRDYLFRMR
jgi:hypothetical protein